MKKIIGCIVSAVMSTTAFAANNTGDLALDPVEYGTTPSLIGGTPAPAGSFPASFTTRHGNSQCTGTVIGPRVLQLAAHCVGDGRSATIRHTSGTYTGVCKHAAEYRRDATADYALCKLDRAIDLPLYERVLQEKWVSVGNLLLLAGMGCTQPGGSGGNNNVLRIGEAPVRTLPVSNNDLVTRGNAALCFGDSGGSAFWRDPKGELWVVGINSRGDIRTTSYLSATFTRVAKNFYNSWRTANGVKVCGLDKDAPKCRGAK